MAAQRDLAQVHMDAWPERHRESMHGNRNTTIFLYLRECEPLTPPRLGSFGPTLSEKGARLAHKMQVGPYIPVGIHPI